VWQCLYFVFLLKIAVALLILFSFVLRFVISAACVRCLRKEKEVVPEVSIPLVKPDQTAAVSAAVADNVIRFGSCAFVLDNLARTVCYSRVTISEVPQ